MMKVMHDMFKNHHDLDDVNQILLYLLKLKNVKKSHSVESGRWK
jgi:hypothetical protein